MGVYRGSSIDYIIAAIVRSSGRYSISLITVDTTESLYGIIVTTTHVLMSAWF